MSLESTILADLYTRLNATGRGKHIHPFSYYHDSLTTLPPSGFVSVSQMDPADESGDVLR